MDNNIICCIAHVPLLKSFWVGQPKSFTERHSALPGEFSHKYNVDAHTDNYSDKLRVAM